MRRPCRTCEAHGVRTLTALTSPWTVEGGIRIPCTRRPTCRSCEREALRYPEADPLVSGVFAGPVTNRPDSWRCKFHPNALATGSATLADGRTVTLCPACTDRLGVFETNTLGVRHFVPGVLSAHSLGDHCECDPVNHGGVVWHRRSVWLEDRAAQALLRAGEALAAAARGELK
ncbi:MAG: hypothetical protein IT186_15995 [Acidobacteria bacterium]|nr:hypothetical protein [Acidobacteriota bacterium]